MKNYFFNSETNLCVGEFFYLKYVLIIKINLFKIIIVFNFIQFKKRNI